MKTMLALALVLAHTAYGGSNNPAEISIYGSSALGLYEALNVEATNPEAKLGGSGGINPLIGQKDFSTSDGALSIFCEKRLYSANCTITSDSEFNDEQGIYLTGLDAVDLFQVLDLETSNPEAPGGINPLLAQKEFATADGQLTIVCQDRLYSDSCSISSTTN